MVLAGVMYQNMMDVIQQTDQYKKTVETAPANEQPAANILTALTTMLTPVSSGIVSSGNDRWIVNERNPGEVAASYASQAAGIVSSYATPNLLSPVIPGISTAERTYQIFEKSMQNAYQTENIGKIVDAAAKGSISAISGSSEAGFTQSVLKGTIGFAEEAAKGTAETVGAVTGAVTSIPNQIGNGLNDLKKTVTDFFGGLLGGLTNMLIIVGLAIFALLVIFKTDITKFMHGKNFIVIVISLVAIAFGILTVLSPIPGDEIPGALIGILGVLGLTM